MQNPDVKCIERINTAHRARLNLPLFIIHPVLEAEAKRHVQEMSRYKYAGDYGRPEISTWTHLGERACNDPAKIPGYPCTGATRYTANATTGWVIGISAIGFNSPDMCSIFGVDAVTFNPDFIHAGAAHQGDLWSVFYGWPRK